jgi:hypothetical protein
MQSHHSPHSTSYHLLLELQGGCLSRIRAPRDVRYQFPFLHMQDILHDPSPRNIASALYSHGDHWIADDRL